MANSPQLDRQPESYARTASPATAASCDTSPFLPSVTLSHAGAAALPPNASSTLSDDIQPVGLGRPTATSPSVASSTALDEEDPTRVDECRVPTESQGASPMSTSEHSSLVKSDGPRTPCAAGDYESVADAPNRPIAALDQRQDNASPLMSPSRRVDRRPPEGAISITIDQDDTAEEGQQPVQTPYEEHLQPTEPPPLDATNEEPSLLPFVYLPASAILQPLWWQCIAFLLEFLVIMFLLCMVLTVTTWRYPDPSTQHQLPDLMLDVLPLWPELEHVTDALLGILVSLCFAVMFALYLVSRGRLAAADPQLLHKIAKPLSTIYLVPWIRFFVCYSAVTMLRIIVIISTVLPATNNRCRTRPDTGNFWWNSVIGVLSFGGSNVHCGDLLFSGHTSVIILALCAIWSYGPVVHRVLRPVGVLLTLCAYFTMLASRSHYTDDIIIATYMSMTLWVLHPHDGVRGAPPLWHLTIQNPVRVICLIIEHTRAWRARTGRLPQLTPMKPEDEHPIGAFA